MDSPIFRTEFKQVYSFPGSPPPHVRRKLMQAGFTFNGEFWQRVVSTTSVLSQSEMMIFLDSDMEQNSRLALRNAGYTDYND